MNPQKSRYRPGPAPKSQTRTYVMTPDGVKATIRTIAADGKSTVVEFPAGTDGKEHPITGSPQFDAIKLERISRYEAEATLMHASKVLGTARREISRDGKTMTITYTGSERGMPVNNVAVYEKQ